MSIGNIAEIALTIIALLAFAELAYRRYRVLDHRFTIGFATRWMLIDVLLVIATAEMVADSLAHPLVITNAPDVFAILARGAMVFGAIVLRVTFDERQVEPPVK